MIIQIENIEKTYPGKTLFTDVNLRLQEGDRLALVGDNGAGKTTLLNIISGEETPDSGHITKARDIKIGYLTQEAIEMGENSTFDEVIESQHTILDIKKRLQELENNMDDLEEYGKLQDKYESMGGYELKAKVNSVLFGLGFKEEDLSRKTTEFSGGWQMRIALAKLLVQKPEVLLLDEPTNHLDLESVTWLENFLKDYSGSIIVVSHDREFLDNMVNQVADLNNGNIKLYKGNYSKFIKDRDLYIEQLKNKRKRQLDEMHRLEVFVERFRYKATKARQAQERQARLDRIREELIEIPESRKKIHFKFKQPPRTGDLVVHANQISKRYGDNVVYENADFKMYRGDKIALVGPNGSGKSTLLKMIAGTLKPDSGKVKYGVHVTHMYYAQHQLDELNTENTVFEELDNAASGWTMGQVRSLLGAFLFKGDDIEKKVSVLSGGEKSRLALAKMLVEPAPFLCLDEPTNHLDISSSDVLETALKEFEGTILFITHDRHLINNVCNKVVEIIPGKITLYDGNYEYYQYKKEMLDKPNEYANAVPRVRDRKKKSKEQKRVEAERRNAIYAATHGLKDRLADINAELNGKRKRLEELNEILSDPKFYTERDDSQSIIKEHGELKKNIQFLEDEWLDISEKIEEAQNA
ncbi:MAG: ATP-binding cassette domain-containing protein [Coriobacteriia bacterium]|nr:ATP-binding cassette domain-containing protein [Coriobacteriia bacterium]